MRALDTHRGAGLIHARLFGFAQGRLSAPTPRRARLYFLRSTRVRAVLATVRLVNAVFYAHHGVMEEEHVIGGRFEVDVAVTLDIAEAAETDSLDRTVDYERVYRLAQDVVTGANAFLIERLAWRIAHAVREAYPAMEGVEVTVRKPNPPVGGPCDRAEVTLALGPA